MEEAAEKPGHFIIVLIFGLMELNDLLVNAPTAHRWLFCWLVLLSGHYCAIIMGTMASQITSLTIVYSTVYSGADQRNIKAPRHMYL